MRYKVIIIGIANALKTGINIRLEIINNIFSVFSNLLPPSSFIDIKGIVKLIERKENSYYRQRVTIK